MVMLWFAYRLFTVSAVAQSQHSHLVIQKFKARHDPEHVVVDFFYSVSHSHFDFPVF